MNEGEIDYGLELKKAYEKGYAEGLKESHKWYDVRQQLPRNDHYVLATDGQQIVKTRYMGQRKGKGYWVTLINVTHWAPMPKLPEG